MSTLKRTCFIKFVDLYRVQHVKGQMLSERMTKSSYVESPLPIDITNIPDTNVIATVVWQLIGLISFDHLNFYFM